MKNKIPKRIAIIGPPGSGKSTFAASLGKLLNMPVHHLDNHMFDGKRKIDHEEFLLTKKTLLSGSSWIIEGCSIKSLEMRFAHADLIIYLNFSRLLCVWRLFKRVFSFQSPVLESGCLKGINLPIIKYTWNFDRDKGKGVEKLRKKYPQVNFQVIHNPKELKAFTKSLTPHRQRSRK